MGFSLESITSEEKLDGGTFIASRKVIRSTPMEGFTRYVARRLILMIPIMLGVSFISYGIIFLLPGGPVRSMLGAQATAEQIETLRARNGLDRPFLVQYFDWLTDILLNQDFGYTVLSDRNITEVIKNAIVPTFWLALSSLSIGIIIGIPAGIISAINQYSLKDNIATLAAFAGLSIPNFWLAIILIMIFGLYIPVLPTLGFVNPIHDPLNAAKHLILPAISLGTAMSALIMRMMRSSLLEVRSEQYIQAARAKGLPEGVVINKHAVKNALLPTVTIIGMTFGSLLGGAVIIEQIFAIPGLGRVSLQAIFQREYRILQSTLLLIAFTFASANLLTDLLYAYLDPRVKYE